MLALKLSFVINKFQGNGKGFLYFAILNKQISVKITIHSTIFKVDLAEVLCYGYTLLEKCYLKDLFNYDNYTWKQGDTDNFLDSS